MYCRLLPYLTHLLVRNWRDPTQITEDETELKTNGNNKHCNCSDFYKDCLNVPFIQTNSFPHPCLKIKLKTNSHFAQRWITSGNAIISRHFFCWDKELLWLRIWESLWQINYASRQITKCVTTELKTGLRFLCD